MLLFSLVESIWRCRGPRRGLTSNLYWRLQRASLAYLLICSRHPESSDSQSQSFDSLKEFILSFFLYVIHRFPQWKHRFLKESINSVKASIYFLKEAFPFKSSFRESTVLINPLISFGKSTDSVMTVMNSLKQINGFLKEICGHFEEINGLLRGNQRIP